MNSKDQSVYYAKPGENVKVTILLNLYKIYNKIYQILLKR